MARPLRGGTVVVAGGFHLACLNPLLADCGDRQASGLFGLVQTLEGDYKTAPDLRYRPDLVSRVTWTRKPPWRLTYHIRPNARWSDGAPVTSADFAFSFASFLRYLTLLQDDPVKSVRTIRVIDTKTFTVTLRSRNAQWRYTFYIVLPKHALAGQDLTSIWRDTIDDPTTGKPIGSGPFLVKSFDVQSGELKLVRNARYWGRHRAYVDSIVFKDVEDPASALRSGDVDLAPVLSPADALALKRARGIKVLASPGLFWEHLEVRVGPGGNPALKNRLVRQALAYGIDRGAIVRNLYGDTAPALRPIDSAIFLAQSPYYRPNWKGYHYQPSKARRLLRQAGCDRGSDGIYVCAGNRLSLRFLARTGSPVRQRTLELIQTQLRRVGIEVKPTYAPISTLLEQILPSGDYDVSLFAWDYSQELFYRYSLLGCNGDDNWTGYCNPAVTRELRRSVHFLDQDARNGALNRVDRQLALDVPVIPLYQVPHFFAYRNSLKGVVDNLVEGLSWNSEDWWLQH
jgi:ABC-type transport system substrate-binding protein